MKNTFRTINIQKIHIFWYLKQYNKNTGQMQYRKNMTKIYLKYTWKYVLNTYLVQRNIQKILWKYIEIIL